MSHPLYKITYVCDCGQDYGSCEKEGAFYMDYNASCDIATIFQKPHPTDKMIYIGAFGDNELHALGKILTTNEGEGNWTKQEVDETKEARGW